MWTPEYGSNLFFDRNFPLFYKIQIENLVNF